jgi:hypothetical protein
VLLLGQLRAQVVVLTTRARRQLTAVRKVGPSMGDVDRMAESVSRASAFLKSPANPNQLLIVGNHPDPPARRVILDCGWPAASLDTRVGVDLQGCARSVRDTCRSG